jgi:hypothetical protein
MTGSKDPAQSISLEVYAEEIFLSSCFIPGVDPEARRFDPPRFNAIHFVFCEVASGNELLEQ